MSALNQVEELLPSLSQTEKEKLLQMVAQQLGGAVPGIQSTSGVCGGDPCIRETRIPVWLLQQYRELGSSEEEILRSYPSLSAQDLVNAWAYVRTHRDEIDQQIRENDQA